MTTRYRLRLSGPLPQTTAELLRSRFHVAELVTGRASTTVTGTVVDQPALRALLGLVWDTGSTVVSLHTEHPIRTDGRSR